MGKDSIPDHDFPVKYCDNLINQSCHIEKVIEKQTTKQTMSKRLCLKTKTDAING